MAEEHNIPKTYDPASVEKKWYQFWEKNKYFHAEPDPEGRWVSVVYPARHYPYYGTRDAKKSTWYYVFVEEDSAWGWVRSTFCTPVN